jgi:hypothetical protein
VSEAIGSCRLRVAFASARHARYAIEFLSGLPRPPIRTWIEDDDALTFVELEIGIADRERVVTLMKGAHGIPIELPTVVADVA